MNLFEGKIEEYKKNCNEDFRGNLDKRCKLSGEEILEIEDLLSLVVMYKNSVLSDSLKLNFEKKIESLHSKLTKEELIELLLANA